MKQRKQSITEKASFEYWSLQNVKSIINTTLIDRAFQKYSENRLIECLKQTEQPRAANYTDSMIHNLVQNELLQSSSKPKIIEEECPDPNLDEVKAKMVKSNKLSKFRNSSIILGKNSIDSIQRTHRFKDTILESQLNDSEIHRFGSLRRTMTNPSSYVVEGLTQTEGKKIYRHEKTFTEINPSKKKHKKSREIFPLIEYQRIVKNESTDKQSFLLNKQIDRQIQFIRNRKLKLQAAFSSFNYKGNRKTYFGGQMDQNVNAQEKEAPTEKNGIKNKKGSELQFRVIITDYDGEIITPIQNQKLKKVNAKNKENLIKNNFMPIVRVNTEITTNYQELQENKRSSKPSKKYIKYKDALSIPSSTAKESKSSEEATEQKLKQKVSIYNTDDDWILNHSLLNNKLQDEKKVIDKRLFLQIGDLRKSRRMIEKLTKSQRKIV